MEAAFCLKSPPSAILRPPRNHFHRCSGLSQHHNFAAFRCTTGFPHSSLRSTIRAQTHSSPKASTYDRKLASAAKAAAAAAALACAVGCIGLRCSRRSQALATSWFVPIQGSADRGRPDSRRESFLLSEQQQKVASEVLVEMSKREDLAGRRITPNYPKLKEYIEEHLRLSDEAWEALINKWKELKPGQGHGRDIIEIGLLLVDIYITKGNAAKAEDTNKIIMEIAPDSDIRPQIRRVVISMISRDWERMKETEKKKNWEKFAQDMQEIASSPFSGREGPLEEP